MREVEGVGAHRKLLDAARAYVGTFAHFSPNARRVLLATVCIYTSWGVFGVLFNLYLVALGHTLAFVGLVAAVTTVGQALLGHHAGDVVAVVVPSGERRMHVSAVW